MGKNKGGTKIPTRNPRKPEGNKELGKCKRKPNYNENKIKQHRMKKILHSTTGK